MFHEGGVAQLREEDPSQHKTVRPAQALTFFAHVHTGAEAVPVLLFIASNVFVTSEKSTPLHDTSLVQCEHHHWHDKHADTSRAVVTTIIITVNV
jgi:hypothetical protein